MRELGRTGRWGGWWALLVAVAGACSCSPDPTLRIFFAVGGTVDGTILDYTSPDHPYDFIEATMGARLKEGGFGDVRIRIERGWICADLPRGREGAADRIVRLLTAPGQIELRVVLSPDDGFDLPAEAAKFSAWRALHPTHRPEWFSTIADSSGPPGGIRWVGLWRNGGLAALSPITVGGLAFEDAAPLRYEEDLRERFDWVFTQADLARARPASVDGGPGRPDLPGIRLEFAKNRRRAFTEFTGRFVGHPLAVVWDGEIRSTALLAEPLPGEMVWAPPPRAAFSAEERDDRVAILNGGALRWKIRESWRKVLEGRK